MREGKKDIDYGEAYRLWEAVNRIYRENPEYQKAFAFREYNLWLNYSQLIFESAKSYSAGAWSAPSAGPWAFMKAASANFLLLILSLCAIAKLHLARPSILIFTLDRSHSRFVSDTRLDPVYEAIEKSQVRFLEVFRTVPGRKTFGAFLKRRRLAVYLEGFDLLAGFVAKMPAPAALPSVEGVGERDRAFVEHCIRHYAHAARVTRIKIAILERLLRGSSLRCLFAVDDVRTYAEIVAAARTLRIASYGVQHGHFTKYHVGWLQTAGIEGKPIAPDQLLVWSEYWKKELMRLGTHFPPQRIVVGGLKGASHSSQDSSADFSEKTVLIPYETAAPHSEVREYIRRLLSCPGVEVLFKLRADREREEQISTYGLDAVSSERLSYTADTAEAFARSYLVAGVYSTFLYDAIAARKRVAVLETSSDYGEGMWANGVADRLGQGDICSKLRELMIPDPKLTKERYTKVFGESPTRMYDTINRIIAQSA